MNISTHLDSKITKQSGDEDGRNNRSVLCSLCSLLKVSVSFLLFNPEKIQLRNGQNWKHRQSEFNLVNASLVSAFTHRSFLPLLSCHAQSLKSSSICKCGENQEGICDGS